MLQCPSVLKYVQYETPAVLGPFYHVDWSLAAYSKSDKVFLRQAEDSHTTDSV